MNLFKPIIQKVIEDVLAKMRNAVSKLTENVKKIDDAVVGLIQVQQVHQNILQDLYARQASIMEAMKLDTTLPSFKFNDNDEAEDRPN